MRHMPLTVAIIKVVLCMSMISWNSPSTAVHSFVFPTPPMRGIRSYNANKSDPVCISINGNIHGKTMSVMTPSSIHLLQRRSINTHYCTASTTTSLRPTTIMRSITRKSVTTNASCLVLGFALLVGYHARLAMMEQRGTPTWRTVQADTREKWSRHVRETEGWLYAVQTLRNGITANTFLATTVLSLLALIAGKIWDILRTATATNTIMDNTTLKAQLASISISMLCSAYYFLQSARLMTHAGFMFPVNTGTKVDQIMRNTESAQWLGLRWLYISVGMILWVVGGERLFLLSNLGLLRFFYGKDAAPKDVQRI